MSAISPPVLNGSFFRALISANRLEERLGRGWLLFFPGMRFASRQKWWGRGGKRKQAHEGLDICFFADELGNRFRLEEHVRVPALFDGHLAGIIPDFLGNTLIVAHPPAGERPPFYILYAHIRPDAHLQVGHNLPAGRTFAAIAPPHAKRVLPPHLHLSLMPADCMPAIESLDWPLLNRLDRARFSDPIEIIGGAWQMMDFIPGVNLYEAFVPCRKLSSLYTS